MTNKVLVPFLAGLLAVLVAGCGAKTDSPAMSQVAARVGDYEITIHQVNAELARLGNAAGGQAKQAAAAILERLIDQELMIAQAEEQKIDRDPSVMAALSAARREVIARAYVERLTAQVGGPQPTEVTAFYRDNPELFSQRRVYALRELRIALPAGQEDAVRSVADKATNLDEIVAWLRREKIAYKVDAGVKPAEDLPFDALKQFARMHENQLGVLTKPGEMTIVQIAGVREQPIDEVAATPLIERYLGNRRKEDFAREDMRRLRERAAIEYVGDFDSTFPSTIAAPQAHEAPRAPEAPQGLSPNALNKGVGGLK